MSHLYYKGKTKKGNEVELLIDNKSEFNAFKWENTVIVKTPLGNKIIYRGLSFFKASIAYRKAMHEA